MYPYTYLLIFISYQCKKNIACGEICPQLPNMGNVKLLKPTKD